MVKLTKKTFNPTKSFNAENLENATEQYDADEISWNNNGVSLWLIKEKQRPNWEPPSRKILNPTQLHNQLIQEESSKISPTACYRAQRSHTKSSLER